MSAQSQCGTNCATILKIGGINCAIFSSRKNKDQGQLSPLKGHPDPTLTMMLLPAGGEIITLTFWSTTEMSAIMLLLPVAEIVFLRLNGWSTNVWHNQFGPNHRDTQQHKDCH